jgi:hypothetical protein
VLRVPGAWRLTARCEGPDRLLRARWSWGIPLAVAHLVVRRVASGTQAATGMLAALVSTLVMVQGVTLIVLGVLARRQGRPSVLGPAWAASSG